jgi:iron(III) transport system ATP-binding protein
LSFLECRDLVKRFGNVDALAGASLAVERGDVLALLGPSGCGKTTLLRAIAGFEVPDQGEVILDGAVLSGPQHTVPPERRRVGMVFQDFALFPHMDVAANLAFGLPRGANRARRVEELLALVGLEGLGKRMPHELSGGQQQRVAIARALGAEPVLMLLDEPFSNLDPSVRQRVRAELRELIRRVGITVVFVTHDQEEALSVAEQVAVMMDGRVHQTGTPREIYARPVSRAVGEFIGEANFLPGEVRGDLAESELGSLVVRADFQGHGDVMVRAEDIKVSMEGGVAAEVVVVEYYGHDLLMTLRLNSGRVVRARQPAGMHLAPGQRVGLIVKGEALAFPGREQ